LQHSALSTQHSALAKRLCSALIFAATLTLPIASKSAACELEYQRVPGLFRLYTPVEKAEISNTFLPRLEDVCNAEILEFPNLVQWSAQIRPAEDKYSNYRYEECWVGSRNDEFQSFLYNHAWPIIRRCKTLPKTLTLTPAPNQKDPRPKGTEGKDPKSSTLELIAKVMEGSTPKAGVAVTFKVDVKEGSGEHSVTSNGDHVHADRPKGKISPLTGQTTGQTNASGEVRIKFEAEILAGTHTVTATCNDCSNKTATKDVKVLVPDLVELTADTGTPRTFVLVGNTAYPGTNHLGNHYFTAAAKETLVNGVIPTMAKAGWGVVGVNDGSLKDGGLFDIKGNWTPSHAEHRKGTEVDLSFKNPKVVGDKSVRDAYKELCKKEGVAFDIQTLWHKNDGYEPHYHIYLSGSGLRSGANQKCCESYKGPKKDKDGNVVLDKKGKPVMATMCEEQNPS
jgi:hypothetical protein